MRSAGRIGAAVAGALILAGCGAASVPRRESGSAVFSASCSGCHSLAGNESLHRQGGDLLGFRMSRSVLLEFAGEMPVARPLSPAQLTAVVDYVYRRQRSRTGSVEPTRTVKPAWLRPRQGTQPRTRCSSIHYS